MPIPTPQLERLTSISTKPTALPPVSKIGGLGETPQASSPFFPLPRRKPTIFRSFHRKPLGFGSKFPVITFLRNPPQRQPTKIKPFVVFVGWRWRLIHGSNCFGLIQPFFPCCQPNALRMAAATPLGFSSKFPVITFLHPPLNANLPKSNPLWFS
jgi:hypothetical protein